MAEEFKPGQIVPESGVYRITHDPVHADVPHEVTVIKGRRFPTCRHCKGITFQLAHAAKHVAEVEHLQEPEGGTDVVGASAAWRDRPRNSEKCTSTDAPARPLATRSR